MRVSAKINWRILVPFVLTPILALGLFIPVYATILQDGQIPERGVLIPLGIFGLLGIWLALTTILRAKKIEIQDDRITIKRIFTGRTFNYSLDEVTERTIGGHSNIWNDYEILQFRTADNRIHSVVSYELTRFDELSKWIKKSKSPRMPQRTLNFVLTEYGSTFIVASIILTVLYIILLNS